MEEKEEDSVSLGLAELFKDISERISESKPLEVEGGEPISDRDKLKSLLNMELMLKQETGWQFCLASLCFLRFV